VVRGGRGGVILDEFIFHTRTHWQLSKSLCLNLSPVLSFFLGWCNPNLNTGLCKFQLATLSFVIFYISFEIFSEFCNLFKDLCSRVGSANQLRARGFCIVAGS